MHLAVITAIVTDIFSTLFSIVGSVCCHVFGVENSFLLLFGMDSQKYAIGFCFRVFFLIWFLH